MSGRRIYLDYNASMPLRPEAREAMLAALDCAGNPSSVHAEGQRARALVETAREQVATLIGAMPSEVVFTSGATEANATVLAGGWDTILMSGIEHDSVLQAARSSGATIFTLPTTADGVARVATIAERVLKGPAIKRGLVTLQIANNETGVIQPVAAVASFAKAHGVAVHTDAVQAVGRIPVSFAALGVDAMSISAHKLGGPAGVGALVVRDGIALPALIPGGQERRRRGGTENVAGIVGFGAAAVAAQRDLATTDRQRVLRDRIEQEVLAITPAAMIIGQDAERLPGTTTIALPGARAETLVIRLDLAGIAVSAGAACSSGKVGPSHVLSAMNMPADIARAAIRISIGPGTTHAEIDTFIAAWRAIHARDGLRVAV